MAFKDEVTSDAALYIGDEPWTLIADATGAAKDALNSIYDSSLNALLTKYQWSFATTLTEATTPPAWVALTGYVVGNYSSSGSSNYRCKTAHTSTNQHWVAGTYEAADVVVLDSVIYTADTETTEEPSGAAADWTTGAASLDDEPGLGDDWEDNWELSFLSGNSNEQVNYQYEILLPSNLLKLWVVHPVWSRYMSVNDAGTTSPTQILLCSTNEVTLEYTFSKTEDFPDFFKDALAYYMASKISLSVTEDMGTKQAMDAEYTRALAVARNTDAQSKQTVGIVDAPLIDVR
jgi:hypothetical protein